MKPDPEMINLMIDVAELASLRTRIEDGKQKPYVSFREAGRKYGSGVVRVWIDQGLVKVLQDSPGTKIRIDRMRLEAVAKACNRGL
jgi:hypothetical protein